MLTFNRAAKSGQELPPQVSEFDWQPLSFGTSSIGNLYRAIDDADAAATLDCAWDAGVRYFDTAPHYGLGLAELRLGKMLQGRPREEFIVSTKVGRLLVPNPEGAAAKDSEHFDVPA